MPALIFYVFFDDLNCGTTGRKDAVGSGPEYGLPIKLLEVFGEFFASKPTRNGF